MVNSLHPDPDHMYNKARYHLDQMQIHEDEMYSEKLITALARQDQSLYLVRLLNKFLLFVIIAAVVYIPIDLIFLNASPSLGSLPAQTALPERDMKSQRMPSQMKPWSTYRQMVQKRNIFQAVLPEIEELPQVATVITPPPAPKQDLNRVMELVGVMLDQNPKAIILMKRQGDTIFASIGQKVGDVVVKDIKEDRVIFDDNGTEVELKQ